MRECRPTWRGRSRSPATTICRSPSAAAATTAPASGPCDGGVVIDLSLLKDIEVDPKARTVRVGGGATWGEVDRATNEHGLATPSGIISTTGVGGLTLGGGLGHLTRKYGLTIDNLLEADLVLANGEQVRASADENPDLFWAIRGGGGNFGVVTSFLFRLHEVGSFVGGPTFWPVEAAVEVLSAYREFLPAAPRELNGFFAFATVPPGPPFPEEIHMRKVCGVVWAYVGSEEDAAKAIAPFLESVSEPLMHGVGPVPHAGLQGAFDGVYPAGDQWYWRADFVKEIPDAAVEIHARFGAALPTMEVDDAPVPDRRRRARRRLVRHGVELPRREAGARSSRASTPTRRTPTSIRQWTVDYFEALHPYSAGGAYVNMMMDEGQERVRASYRDNYDRLARIKATYDPENLFRINQNIQPNGGAA